MDKISIAIDIDETLCDLYWKWLQFYNTIFDRDIKLEDITNWDIREFIEEDHREYFLNILETHKFYRNLRPKEHSKETLEALNDRYDIVIVTDAFSRMGYKAKHDWLFEEYPFLKREQLIFCASKHFIKADYMIDDSLHHLDNFSGVPVLMDAPHNQKSDIEHRVYNWRHIYDEFIINQCEVCGKPFGKGCCIKEDGGYEETYWTYDPNEVNNTH